MVEEFATGFPGYDSGMLPANAALISEVLKGNGYSTAAFGKWHNTPNWESGPTGPFDRWPTNLGFQYFYGFLGRRHEPVVARPGRKHQADRAARTIPLITS